MSFEGALRVCASSFCKLTAEQVDLLRQHFELLVRWNRKLNLTAVIEPEEAARKHYGESLYLATHLPVGVQQVADVGSGAGFPGFPIAVLRPGCTVTLIESDTRKAAFLHECRELVSNLVVVHARAEAVKSRFDALVSRAVRLDEIESLMPRLAPLAFSFAPCTGSTWNLISRLPWDPKSCLVSRETGN